MALPSESMIEIIEADPIKDELKPFLATFSSTYPNAKPTDSPAAYENLLLHRNRRDLALKFIGTLLLLPAASALPSRERDGPLSGDIALLYSSLSSSRTDIKLIAGLLHAVVTHEDDQKIWTKVYEVLAQIKPLPLATAPLPTTPPPSRPPFPPLFQQTPWTFSTGSFLDTSEYRKQVDDILRAELIPSLRIDIPDFFHAIWGRVSRLDELAETVFDLCQEGDTPLYEDACGWTKWPSSAKEELVLEWLQETINRCVVWMREKDVHAVLCRRIYRGPKTYLDGSTVKRKMDVGITAHDGQVENDEDGLGDSHPNWAQVLVTGELKSNPIEDGQEKVWLDLATYAREVFRTQERRYVLGFTLCGPMMRLWHFDRSGSSGSSSFNINQDGFKFIQIMLGYYLMNNEQLGLDPTIQQSDGKHYIEITRDDRIERLFLTEEIRKQAAIIGRATTCWRVYCDGDDSKEPLIMKDSWQYEERPEEGELIKEATDKGVRNIARYYHHETVQVDEKNDDTIGNVRKGLMKICSRTTFRQKSSNEPEAQTSDLLEKTVTSQINSRKRSSDLAQMAPPLKKRSSLTPGSITLETSSHNRVHRRIITRDPGRPIYKASSRLAIITGFIGAISGHESLLNAGILHRDVSIGNIMLTEKEDDGFLIDLDLAIKTSNDQASGAPSKTGTRIFMAIGALLDEHHCFMHDLESFFWVLFWICIHFGGLDETGKAKRRVVPKYEKWNYADVRDLAERKKGVVSDENDFDGIMEQCFSAYCKPFMPCVRALRKEIFPNNQRWKTEDHRLYSAVKAVLEKAKEDLML